MNSILGCWRVVDSNRPQDGNPNSNSIGCKGLFLGGGVHYIFLKDGERFRLGYDYNEIDGYIDLIFSDGLRRRFKLNMYVGGVVKMMIKDEESGYFDVYQYIGEACDEE